MKRFLLLAALVLALSATPGCFWMSGPWTSSQSIEEKYDKEIKIGMLQADVEKVLGKPSQVIWDTDKEGRVAEGSRAAWLLWKYDYPEDPLLVSIKVDYFGIVTEKHFDDKETVAKLQGAQKSREDELSYPGAPQRRFRELENQRTRSGQ